MRALRMKQAEQKLGVGSDKKQLLAQKRSEEEKAYADRIRLNIIKQRKKKEIQEQNETCILKTEWTWQGMRGSGEILSNLFNSVLLMLISWFWELCYEGTSC